MKKLISIICAVVLAIMCSNAALAQNSTVLDGFQENMNKLWLKNKGDSELLKTMEESRSEYVINSIKGIMSAPSYARKGLGLTGRDDEQIEQIKKRREVDFDKGIKIYTSYTNEYLKQYFENGCFDYLLGHTYWAIPHTSSLGFMLFDEDGDCAMNKLDTAKNIYQSAIMYEDGFEFITNQAEIENMLIEQGETQVDDIKVVVMDAFFTFIYIRCEQKEYLVRILDERHEGRIQRPDIECFKLYSVEDVIQKIGEFDNSNSFWKFPENVFEEKFVYEAEALALQEAGLLQGNEKGLDLLKPLTRIEAAALLIRALGLEDQTANYTESGFSDVASDNWGAPYAALAKAKGITNGISDTEFAPEQKVTSDQFATFALRAIGESDFDYTEGTEILVNQGIITEEQAQKMDLFTRGDMAKIIYEMRQHGMM